MFLDSFVQDYVIFLLKALTVLMVFLMALGASQRQKKQDDVQFENLNTTRHATRLKLIKALHSDRKTRKKHLKTLKIEQKKTKQRRKLFVLDFKGDLKASQVTALRKQITCVLDVAKPTDQVLVRLESPGGMVSAYGLAASQLARFRAHNIKLTVCIDQVAASGGYMMACVADHIVAAPFAMIGSVGVILQQPNLHDFLQKHHIGFEQLTAGAYKRTLSTFAKNTGQGRQKALEQLEEIHDLFKKHIAQYRPNMVLENIATGEVWLGKKALDLALIDEIHTSDDWIMQAMKQQQVVWVTSPNNASKIQKLLQRTHAQVTQWLQPNYIS